ncbi:hypothetical protein BH23CHL2_BH23CHL2_34530 [soil metagenome]
MRTLVVVRDGRYLGVLDWLTVRRLTRDDLTSPVARFARTDVPILRPETTIADAMAAFESTDVRALGLLPVVDATGKFKGQIEREEFQGLMTDSLGRITVPEDPIARLVSGPDVPEPGARVVSSDGRKLGTFKRHVEDRGRPRWIEVQHGPFWRRRRRRVLLVAIDRQSSNEIVLSIDRATWHTFSDRPRR